MIKALAVVTLILFVLTLGCGFAIHFGGEAFQGGIKGHMVLGMLTFISFVALLISLFVK